MLTGGKMDIYSNHDARLLHEHLSHKDSDIFIISKRDKKCETRKKSGIRRHIMIDDECVICGGITEKEFEARCDKAERNNWYSEPNGGWY